MYGNKIELSDIDTGNLVSICFSGCAGTDKVFIQEMGDVWNDDVYVGGKININDVIALRKGIIGEEDIINDVNFSIGRTDVNFSNAEVEKIGDIGDVISTRRRILKGKWMDVIRYGDVNLDGDINTKDLTLLQKYLNSEVTLNSRQLENANVDLINGVDQDDFDWLMSYISGQIDDLPIIGLGGC